MIHPHYDMILLWIKDTSQPLEYRDPHGTWRTLSTPPKWDPAVQYRFKTIPETLIISGIMELEDYSNPKFRITEHWETSNIRLTFEDGKLVEAKVL